MTYGDIHVHVDDSEAGKERLQLAARIALYSGAHVTGFFINLSPKPLTELAPFDEAGLRSHAYDDELRLMVECRERDLSRAEAMFKAQLEGTAIRGSWCALAGESLSAL